MYLGDSNMLFFILCGQLVISGCIDIGGSRVQTSSPHDLSLCVKQNALYISNAVC